MHTHTHTQPLATAEQSEGECEHMLLRGRAPTKRPLCSERGGGKGRTSGRPAGAATSFVASGETPFNRRSLVRVTYGVTEAGCSSHEVNGRGHDIAARKRISSPADAAVHEGGGGEIYCGRVTASKTNMEERGGRLLWKLCSEPDPSSPKLFQCETLE